MLVEKELMLSLDKMLQADIMAVALERGIIMIMKLLVVAVELLT